MLRPIKRDGIAAGRGQDGFDAGDTTFPAAERDKD
jgi:hypothetical protein